MLESQADIDKPKYDRVTQWTQVNNYTLTNINEASSFWKSLWEEEWSRDTEAEWNEEIREVVEDVAPEVPTDRSSIERKTGAHLVPTVVLMSG